MKNEKDISDWLRRAKSSLEKAKINNDLQKVLYEDLCYDLQQSVEKSLKALCISYDIIFPKTHSINYLLELLSNKISIPDEINKSKILTNYAVQTRYPGDYEPVIKNDYIEALEIAELVIRWVELLLKKQ